MKEDKDIYSTWRL